MRYILTVLLGLTCGYALFVFTLPVKTIPLGSCKYHKVLQAYKKIGGEYNLDLR